MVACIDTTQDFLETEPCQLLQSSRSSSSAPWSARTDFTFSSQQEPYTPRDSRCLSPPLINGHGNPLLRSKHYSRLTTSSISSRSILYSVDSGSIRYQSRSPDYSDFPPVIEEELADGLATRMRIGSIAEAPTTVREVQLVDLCKSEHRFFSEKKSPHPRLSSSQTLPHVNLVSSSIDRQASTSSTTAPTSYFRSRRESSYKTMSIRSTESPHPHPFASPTQSVTPPQSHTSRSGLPIVHQSSPLDLEETDSMRSERLNGLLVLVSSEDHQDQEKCPVCVENLSSTYRLPGEKPPIVPECGHALHEVSCSIDVYDDLY
jgi:hypothetical protein